MSVDGLCWLFIPNQVGAGHFPAPTQPGINTPHNPSTDILHSPAYEDGTDSEFRNVGYLNSDAGELPKKEHIIT